MNNIKKYRYIGLAAMTLVTLCNSNHIFAEEASSNNTVTINRSISEHSTIYTANNISLNGQGKDISQDLKNKLIGDDYTIIIKYNQQNIKGVQALFGMSNPNSGNRNSYISIFLRDNGELGLEARDTNSHTNHLMARPASVWGKFKNAPVTNTVALVSNSKNKTYTLYANGTKVVEKTFDNFLTTNDIEGISSYMLGGVTRDGHLDYKFFGNIQDIAIYNDVINDIDLEQMTLTDVADHLIYKAGDETGSNYFRIPVLYTLSNGRVFSSIDARYGGTHDFLNKINIATSYSDNGGLTWTKPKLTLAFDDFAPVPLDWPREPGSRDLQISGGATYIDSVIVENKNHKAFLFADVMPAGVSFRAATRTDSGFKEMDGNYYIKLKKTGENGYNYTIRQDGVVYDDRTNTATNYSVDEDFAIKENGNYLKTEQYSVSFENNKKEEFKNGKKVNMNIFYKDALFKVVPTNYIAYISSDDFGESWTKPTLLPPLMGIKRNSPYLGPGRGIVVKSTGRIIIPSYTGKESVYIYSDDNGLTWQQKTIPLPGNWSAEAQLVELHNGVLQAYMRTNNGKIAYMTSEDGGDTWKEPEYLDFISNPGYGTQLSIINYSQKIDGKDAIILSTPNSRSGRRHGQIWIGLVNQDNTIDWRYHHDVDNSQYGYSYSCLTELPNHEIGLMFEKFDSWSRNELHMKNVVPYVSFNIDELKIN